LDAVVNGDNDNSKQPDIFIASSHMITTSLNAKHYSKMIITEPYTYDIKSMEQLKARIKRLDSVCKNPEVYLCAADIEKTVVNLLQAKYLEMETGIINLIKHKESDPFSVIKQTINTAEKIYNVVNSLTGANMDTSQNNTVIDTTATIVTDPTLKT
jgi:hypothetical protein